MYVRNKISFCTLWYMDTVSFVSFSTTDVNGALNGFGVNIFYHVNKMGKGCIEWDLNSSQLNGCHLGLQNLLLP